MSPLNSGGGTFQLFIEIFIPLYLYRLSTRGCAREREGISPGEAERRAQDAKRGGGFAPSCLNMNIIMRTGFVVVPLLRFSSFGFAHGISSRRLAPPRSSPSPAFSAPILRTRTHACVRRSAVTTTKPDACHCASGKLPLRARRILLTRSDPPPVVQRPVDVRVAPANASSRESDVRAARSLSADDFPPFPFPFRFISANRAQLHSRFSLTPLNLPIK